MGSSRKVRRLKRKLKKNLDVIAFMLFIAVGGLYFGNRLFSKKENPMVMVKSDGQRSSVNSNAAAAPGSKNIEMAKKYLEASRLVLGKDAAGLSAFVLLMRNIAPAEVEKDPKLNQLCKTQDACPLPLKDVYEIGLARLDKAQLYKAKLNLQESLVKSKLHRVEKLNILAKHLIGTGAHKSKKTSQNTRDKKVQLSGAAEYVLVTSKQLKNANIPDQEYLTVVYKALGRSEDLVAKRLILQALQKAMPNYKDQIAQAANKMKVKL